MFSLHETGIVSAWKGGLDRLLEQVQSQAVGKTGEENSLTRIMYCEPAVKDFRLIFFYS